MTDVVTRQSDADKHHPASRGFWHRLRRAALIALSVGVALVTSVVAFAFGLPLLWVPAVFGLVLLGAAALWFLYRLLRRLLWRLSRRLAFTYFLVGVLPIPMGAFLLGVAAYLMAGFFLGHLFRSALASVHQEVTVAAETFLGDSGRGRASSPLTEVAMATYEGGRWVGGDPRAPEL